MQAGTSIAHTGNSSHISPKPPPTQTPHKQFYAPKNYKTSKKPQKPQIATVPRNLTDHPPLQNPKHQNQKDNLKQEKETTDATFSRPSSHKHYYNT
jgi:hypothetical protein